VDPVSKLSITVLCYYNCLPQTHNNKMTGYSYHAILMLPPTRPCWLMHTGTAASPVPSYSVPCPGLLHLLSPPAPTAEQLVCRTVRESKQAREGGADSAW